MSRDFVNASSQWASTTTVPVSAVPFSWACWFRPNSTTTNRELMWLGNSGSLTNYWTIGVTTSAIRNSARNSTESPANTTAGPTANVWNHACGTFGSNSARAAYLDGANKGTNATSQTPSGINRFAIASLARSTPTNFFDGQLAHVAVWNVELTDDEAAMLGLHRVSPLFVRPSALVWYSPYVGRDSVEIDIIGGGSLTLTNSPASSAEEPPVLWLPGRRRIFLPAASGQSYAVSTEDVLDLSDAVEVARLRVLQIDEPLEISDDVQVSRRFSRLLEDALSLLDDLSAIIGGAVYAVLLDEQLVVLDDTQRMIAYSRLFSDDLAATDEVLVARLRGRVVDDVLTAVDLLGTAVQRSRMLDESLPIDDLLVRAAAYTRALLDPIDVVDSLIAQYLPVVSLTYDVRVELGIERAIRLGSHAPIELSSREDITLGGYN